MPLIAIDNNACLLVKLANHCFHFRFIWFYFAAYTVATFGLPRWFFLLNQHYRTQILFKQETEHVSFSRIHFVPLLVIRGYSPKRTSRGLDWAWRIASRARSNAPVQP